MLLLRSKYRTITTTTELRDAQQVAVSETAEEMEIFWKNLK
jgi:hypothetical protein